MMVALKSRPMVHILQKMTETSTCYCTFVSRAATLFYKRICAKQKATSCTPAKDGTEHALSADDDAGQTFLSSEPIDAQLNAERRILEL